MKTHYKFQIDARKWGKQNLMSVLAFALVFWILEAAFVVRWLHHSPVSFWIVNLLFLGIVVFFTFHWLRHLFIKGAYEFHISDSMVLAKSPHRIMGESFSIYLDDITKLQHLYSENEGVRNQTDKLYRIYYQDKSITLTEYPGHTGHEIFEIIRKLREKIVYEERPTSFDESKELFRQSARNLRG